MAARRVSVIVPTLNEGDNLVDTVACVIRHSAWPDLEVVVADDGSSDGSVERALALSPAVRAISGGQRGVARTRNAGAQASTGDVLVFLDAHCYVPQGWLAPLVEVLEQEEAGMVGPAFSNIRGPQMVACGVTWRDFSLGNVWLPRPEGVVEVPFHIGACQALRSDVFQACGGYDEGMTRWGSEDIELCLRLWLMGYRVYGQPASLVYHLFRTSRPYSVDVQRILYNHLRMVFLHFDEGRLARVLREVMKVPGAEQAVASLMVDDTWLLRRRYWSERRHDLDWFLQRWNIQL